MDKESRMGESIHSARHNKIRTMLVRERKRSRLTQAEVAIRLNKPQSYVSKYESGEKRLLLMDFLDIAKAIGFDADDFIRKVNNS